MIEPFTVIIHGKPILITKDTIERSFQWYADHARLCASEAKAGAFHVNDLEQYVRENEEEALSYERQKKDGPDGRYSLAFIQQAYYIQSGESVPMLSK